MSLTCALSGEPLATTKEDVVVTPSGNVCIKRLLLQKLTENGGMDPFEQIREVPLNEDQLITLSKATAGSAIPPPRPQSTSLPNLLQTIQTEYDALILELFDTRKALEETRKELSQALYQNDAAVRVVARLAQERDAARQELERWNASVGGGGSAAAVETAEVGVEPPPPAAEEEEDEGTGEPQAKKRRVESLELPLKNDVPVDDLNIMVETNGELMAKRKPALKAAAAAAPSPEELAGYTEIENKAWHKSTCRSIHCLASSGGTNNNFIATAGKDNQIVIYDSVEKVAKYTFKHAGVTRVDVNDQMVVAGDAKGKIVAYSLGSGEMIGEFSTDKGAIVGISIHQSQKHIVAATSEGNLIIASVTSDGKLEQISYFEGDEDEKYTSGTIHPDGLIYAVGTKTGKLCLWDIKNKKLAATMVVSSEKKFFCFFWVEIGSLVTVCTSYYYCS